MDGQVAQVLSLFPDASEAAVRASLAKNGGNVDQTVNCILEGTLGAKTQEELDAEFALGLMADEQRTAGTNGGMGGTGGGMGSPAMAGGGGGGGGGSGFYASAQAAAAFNPSALGSPTAGAATVGNGGFSSFSEAAAAGGSFSGGVGAGGEVDDEIALAIAMSVSDEETAELNRILPAGAEVMVSEYVPFWYDSGEGFDVSDNKWGCGYRSLQMLLHELREKGFYRADAVPTVAELVAMFQDVGEAEIGSWIDIDTMIRWLATNVDVDVAVMGYDNRRKKTELIERLVNHVVEHDIFCMVVGSGVIGVLGGVRNVSNTAELFVVDPHGHPRPFTPEWCWDGGEGWVRFDFMFEEAVSPEIKAFMTPQEILRNLGWTLIFLTPTADAKAALANGEVPPVPAATAPVATTTPTTTTAAAAAAAAAAPAAPALGDLIDLSPPAAVPPADDGGPGTQADPSAPPW